MRVRARFVTVGTLGLVAFVGVVLVSFAGLAEQGIDWHNLPYFAYLDPRLLLMTDGSWQGAAVVDAGKVNNPSPKDLRGKLLPWSYIWAATCTTGAQLVSFSKTFMAPGVPLSGADSIRTDQLELGYGPGNQFKGDSPYKSAVFLVNGTEAARLGDIAASPRKVAPEFRGPLPESALNAFQYGANTVTIRVEKVAQKQGEPCNNPPAGRYIAVRAALELQFGSRLQVLPPEHPLEIKKNVKSGDQISTMGTVRFLNAGPSASLEGSVRISIQGPGISSIAKVGNTWTTPLTDCTFLDAGLVECSFKNFQAGVTASYTYRGATKVETVSFNKGAGEIHVTASIHAPRGAITPTPGTITQTAVVVLCAAGATDPRCG